MSTHADIVRDGYPWDEEKSQVKDIVYMKDIRRLLRELEKSNCRKVKYVECDARESRNLEDVPEKFVSIWLNERASSKCTKPRLCLL